MTGDYSTNGITRASLRDEFPLAGDRVPHRRTTATPQQHHSTQEHGPSKASRVSLRSSGAPRLGSRASLLAGRPARPTDHLNPLRDIRHALNRRDTCTLSARAARRKFGPSFAVRNPCARVVSASLHAVTFDTIWSSEVRAIHSSLARLRLTHLCRADQRSQCVTVVTSGPDDAVLTWC